MKSKHQEYIRMRHLFELLRLIRTYTDRRARLDRKGSRILYTVKQGRRRTKKIMQDAEARRIFVELYGE